jgi:hypothetical protein
MTAVEWLKSELTEVDRNLINKTFLQLNNSLAGHRLKDIFEQAKEMEKQHKEQDRNVYLNGYIDGSRSQAKFMYNEEDLECAWSSSEQNMRFQFSSSAYKGITFKQWLEKFKEEHCEKE